MTTEQFAYWLQGFSELTGGTPPTAEQWQSIQDHLKTVFVKVTPPLTAGAGLYDLYRHRDTQTIPITQTIC